MALHGVLSTALLLAWHKTEYINAPWLWAASLFVGLASIVSAISLWYWKRWGLYLYVVATFVSMGVGLVVYPSQIAAFYNLIPLLVLGYIMTGQHKMELLT